MTVEKRTIRTDIPGHQALLHGGSGASVDETRRMVVGRDIALKGDIASCDHLIVEGVVEAKMLTTRRLDILEHGLFAGVAEAHDACISGRFQGHLCVRGRLTVKAGAYIVGDVEYGEIEAEAGCRLEVNLRVLAPLQQEMNFVPSDLVANDVAPAAEAEERPKSFRRTSGA